MSTEQQKKLDADWDRATVVLHVPLTAPGVQCSSEVREIEVSLAQLTDLIAEHLEVQAFGREDSVSVRSDLPMSNRLPTSVSAAPSRRKGPPATRTEGAS